MTARQEDQVSEAQIAVHWREEGYYPPSAKFIAQANAGDPDILERFSEHHFPDCFKEYGGPARLGLLLAHHAGHQ
jgi:acetyl-CoA synthetase